LDLKFPHHEAEIAQAEGATGESPLVNFWLHIGLLTMKGEKMSKSLGNVYGLAEALETFGPDVVRFYYLNAHYRSPLDFEPGRTLEEAREAYRSLAVPSERLRGALAAAGPMRPGEEVDPELAVSAARTLDRLDEALSEDFNTREAIAILYGWGKAVAGALPESDRLSSDSLATLLGPFDWARDVLGLLGGPAGEDSSALPALVAAALAARARARVRGDFAEADRIRHDLAAAGIVLEDDADTTRWRRGPAGA
ncbi:MAG TPA: DALR domain-containing protein, partial [Thermoplasmata archaeon]|nr:DALR domain-containing protein [Thermoplasmata archaeon]